MWNDLDNGKIKHKMHTLDMDVKISARKKSENDIACIRKISNKHYLNILHTNNKKLKALVETRI